MTNLETARQKMMISVIEAERRDVVGAGSQSSLGPRDVATSDQRLFATLSDHRAGFARPRSQRAAPNGTRNLRDIAAHPFELLDELGADEFAIAALSVDGTWGTELTLLPPDRVALLGAIQMHGYVPSIATDNPSHGAGAEMSSREDSRCQNNSTLKAPDADNEHLLVLLRRARRSELEPSATTPAPKDSSHRIPDLR